MKKIFLVIFLLLNTLYADFLLNNEEQAWLDSQRKITIGIQNKWIPLSYVEGNTPKGLGVDYINLINTYLDGKLVIEPDTFKNNLEKVKQGNLDAMIDITPTLEREKYYAFTTPYASIPHYIVTRKNSKKHFEYIEDLSGQSIAVEKGYGIIKSLKNLPGQYNLKYYDNTEEALEAVSTGFADAYIGNRAVVNYLIQKNFITNLDFHGKSTISRSILAIGVHKDNKILRDILQKAYNNITLEEKNKIFKKYIGELATNYKIDFTQEELTYLNKAPVIKVGGEKDWPPFDFVDEQGEYQGIAKDIMQQVSTLTGLKFKYVTGQTWKELLTDFEKGQLDILPAIYKTQDRDNYTEFTEPYFTVKDYAFVRRDDNTISSLEDLKSKRIAFIDGYAIEKNLKQRFPQIKLLKVKSQEEGLNAVLLKKADVYIDGYAVVMHKLNSEFITGIKPVLPLDFYVNKLRVGVTKTQPVLASIIQKSVAAISDKDKNTIFQKWFLNTASQKEETNAFTKEEQAWLDKNPTIRLAYMNYWPTNNNGENIHTKYIELLSEYGNININLMKYDSWKKGFNDAVKGDVVHGILNLSWSKEREEKSFDYTEPYFFTPVYVIVKKENQDINNIEDLANNSVFTKENSITNQIVKELKYNIGTVTLNEEKDMYKALSHSNTQAKALLTYTYDEELLEQYNLKVASKIFNKYGEIYIGVSKEHHPLHSIINKSFAKIPKKLLSTIQNTTYKKKKETKVKLTKKEKAFIKANPVLRVHNEKNWPPFNFYEFGEAKGYSIDLMNIVAQNTGLKVEYITGPSWSEFLEMMKEDKLDVMMNIIQSDERSEYMLFTDPFLNAIHGIAVHEDNKDINSFADIITKKKTVALEKGFFYAEVFKKDYPEVPLKIVSNSNETLAQVSYKNADVTLGILPVLNYLSEKEYIRNLRFFVDGNTEIFKPLPLRFAVRDELPELQSILQKGLSTVTQEQKRELSNKWLGKLKHQKVKIDFSKEEQEWLANHKEIRYTGDPDWLPFEAFDNEEYIGIVAEHLKIIEDRIGVRFKKVVPQNWDDAVQKALNREVDMISEVVALNKISTTMDYTKSYIETPLVVMMQNNQNQPFVKNLNTLKNKKIAYVAGYGYVNDLIKEYPEINFLEVATVKDGLEQVSTGQIDVFIATLTTASYNINELGISNVDIVGKLNINMQLGFAVRKDWDIFIGILNKAIDTISLNESKDIKRLWLGDTLSIEPKVKLTPKEEIWLKNNKSLRYVYDIDWAPFEWKNELGEHTGIIYDILLLIEQKSGINFQQIETNKWSEAVELMKSNKADMYSGLGENPERKEYVNFTKNTIFKTPYVFVSKEKDKNDYLETFKVIKNKKVAVVDGYTIHGILKENVPKLPLLTVKSIGEGFEKVRSGELDIFIVNAATAKYFINRQGFNDLKIATKTEFNLELKIALQKNVAPEALSIIEKAINALDEQEISDIYFKWTEVLVEEKTDWSLLYKVGGGAFVLLLLITYWNRRLKKAVDNKTKELKKLLSSFDENVIASKTDLNGVITYVSKAFCTISGYKEEELIGKPQNIMRHPDTPKAVFKHLWSTIKSGQSWRGEIKNRKKDGNFYWVDLIVEPDLDEQYNVIGYASISQDITSKKEVEELSENLEQKVEERTAELIASQKNIETILSNIMLPVLITSKKDRTILYANEYASIQYETSIEELVGSSIDKIYTSMDQKNEILEVMTEYGFVENLEERYKTRTGKEFIGLLSVKPIVYNNHEAFIGMVVDITKQKEIEEEIRLIHKHTQSSIEYASLIQHSLIPSNELFRNYFDDYFALWHPKDIVGGDIYLFEELRDENECLLMVIDCTGHGVPGAFVTMLVKALERQVVARIVNNKDIVVSPAEILQYFNKTMKKLLKQEDEDSISNAGFDGAIIYYNKKEQIVRFAGAELPLFYVQNDEFKTIRGNRQSIGYKKSDANFEFKEHEIKVEEGMQFYLTSDGYLDQNGGEKGFPLGKKRFMNILDTYKKYSFADQQEVLLNELHTYQGDEERNDDISIVGFKIGSNESQ